MRGRATTAACLAAVLAAGAAASTRTAHWHRPVAVVYVTNDNALVDGRGGVLFVGGTADDRHVLVQAMSPSGHVGRSRQEPGRLAFGGLSGDARGDALNVWTQGDAHHDALYISRRSAGGRFETPRRLLSGPHLRTQGLTSADGHQLLFWRASPSGVSSSQGDFYRWGRAGHPFGPTRVFSTENPRLSSTPVRRVFIGPSGEAALVSTAVTQRPGTTTWDWSVKVSVASPDEDFGAARTAGTGSVTTDADQTVGIGLRGGAIDAQGDLALAWTVRVGSMTECCIRSGHDIGLYGATARAGQPFSATRQLSTPSLDRELRGGEVVFAGRRQALVAWGEGDYPNGRKIPDSRLLAALAGPGRPFGAPQAIATRDHAFLGYRRVVADSSNAVVALFTLGRSPRYAVRPSGGRFGPVGRLPLRTLTGGAAGGRATTVALGGPVGPVVRHLQHIQVSVRRP